LTKIINGSLRHCYFPSAWKKATIITIPKPDKDPKLLESYRPIALLSVLSNIFEKIILQELNINFVEKIRPKQATFRLDHSTSQS